MKHMKEKSEQGRVPKLRFPEFRDAPEWETSLLGTKTTKNRRLPFFLRQTHTAQANKFDALKAHKKGLMQQLFTSADEVTR